MKKILLWTNVLVLLPLLLILTGGCKKESVISSTTDAVNMTSYFKKYPDEFSELTKILARSGTASFLNAYGSYTMFAPNNAAIKEYLSSIGKSAVEDLSEDDWKNFVRFHLLEDSIATAQFTDGKLGKLTMYGQYLITGSSNINGVTKYRVNRQADIEHSNISVGNGIIHVINHVLTPADQTLAQLIEANSRYSIFTKALKETGLYDTLNILPANNTDAKKQWLTVIAESDSALNAKGIADYSALKTKYSKSGNPSSFTDSLHLWVDYHIVYNAKYLADIITADAHNTLAPQEVLTSRLAGQTVLINDDEFNGVREPGFSLIRTYSDVTANNGVLHDASEHFGIKLRSPYPIYFDVTSTSDFQKLTGYYQKVSYTFPPLEAYAWSDIKWSSTGSLSSDVKRSPIYQFGSGQSTSKTSYKQDILVCPLGTSTHPSWMEFRTPLVIKGKYKVWICIYVQAEGSTTCEVQTTIRQDGVDSVQHQLSNARTLSFTTKRPGLKKTVNGVSVDDPDAEEAIGWKSYMESTAGAQIGRLVGIVDIKQTGRYWIRITPVNGKQFTNNVDMIQLIPSNMDQQYPKFKPDGTRIERP